jgi:hypothetical protein
MTHDELMKQSAEALLRWLDDKTLPVEYSQRASGLEWRLVKCEPLWILSSDYDRIAEPPKVKRVPLGPNDFPPGPHQHCIRPTIYDVGYRTVTEVLSHEVRTHEYAISYEGLADHYLRWIDGKWQPCWKEVPDDSTSQQH